jgi:hypothetical protein
MRLRPVRLERWCIAATMAMGTALSGCGSSTSPTSSKDFHEAEHLDTLAVNAAAGGQFDRYRLLTYPIAVLAENVTPASVSLTVDGAATEYQAAVLELVGTTAGSNPVPSDSVFFALAWTGTNVDELIVAEIAEPDTLIDVEDLSDTVANTGLDSIVALTITPGTFTKGCQGGKLPLVNAAASDLLTGSTCKAGTATAAFSLFFTAAAGHPHTHFLLSSQQLPAARLVLAATNGGQDRLRSLRTRLRASALRQMRSGASGGATP